MSRSRLALAFAAGLLLGVIPFARYAHFGGRGEAHADHEPRHGGQLGMVGEHHVELVRRRGRVEAFVSDAWRRPVQVRQGSIAFDGGPPTPLERQDRRLVGGDRPAARLAQVVVVLADDTRLEISFDLGASPSG